MRKGVASDFGGNSVAGQYESHHEDDELSRSYDYHVLLQPVLRSDDLLQRLLQSGYRT
jgi:hypothetical protein